MSQRGQSERLHLTRTSWTAGPPGLPTWKWTKGPARYNFGNPNLGTSYSLCVFGDQVLASENVIPSGAGWSGNGISWKLKRDASTTPGGINGLTLRAGGPGKSQIKLKGHGPLVSPASIPLTTPVTAQLVSANGLCFGATYAAPTANANGRFNANGE